ncbi:MAG: STAS domain-containing protein [Lachnospiraceae bacterium]|nr:STAS domain-containing protein [Lachnospiraceae bacterium]
MDIKETSEGGIIILKVSGEIDGSNVLDFEHTLKHAAERTDRLVLDLENLEYVSSAGLRAFLIIQKEMKKEDHTMTIKHVNEEVMGIFMVTGFVKLLNIEED